MAFQYLKGAYRKGGNGLSGQIVSLHSSQITCPCFQSLCFLFVCEFLAGVPCSFTQTWHFSLLSIHWNGLLLNLDEVIIEDKLASLGLFSFQGLIQQYSSNQIFEAKICSLESKVCSLELCYCDLAFCLPPNIKILNATISWSLQPRLPFTFTLPTSQSLLYTDHK